VPKGLLNPEDAVICLLDSPSGLLQTVKDIGVAELRANTTMLARLAALLDVPLITTASEPKGPNGPLMPEIHQAAPHAQFVPRQGEINPGTTPISRARCAPPAGRRSSWPASGRAFALPFRRSTPRRRATASMPCTTLPATPANSPRASPSRASPRPESFPTSTNAVLCEFQQHWRRGEENAKFAALYTLVAPNYGAVIESYTKAQEPARE
jgi:hypothetical protein